MRPKRHHSPNSSENVLRLGHVAPSAWEITDLVPPFLQIKTDSQNPYKLLLGCRGGGALAFCAFLQPPLSSGHSAPCQPSPVARPWPSASASACPTGCPGTIHRSEPLLWLGPSRFFLPDGKASRFNGRIVLCFLSFGSLPPPAFILGETLTHRDTTKNVRGANHRRR